jgi:hypothetical protein
MAAFCGVANHCCSQHYSIFARITTREEENDEEAAKKKNQWRQDIIHLCMAQSHAFRSQSDAPPLSHGWTGTGKAGSRSVSYQTPTQNHMAVTHSLGVF